MDVCCLKYGVWNVRTPEVGAVNALVTGGYAPLTAMVLAARGLKTSAEAGAYLDCNCPLPSPFSLTDMDLCPGAKKSLSLAIMMWTESPPPAC